MCSPNDVSVDAAAILALDEQMDEIVDRWTEHIRDTLRELVVQAKVVSKRSKGVDPLNLAIITFGFAKSPYGSKRCAFSSSVSKLYMRVAGNPDKRNALSPYEKIVHAKGSSLYHDVACRRIYVPKPTSFVRTLIKMAGLEADTATATDMDALDLRWLANDNRIYSWRTAVSILKGLDIARSLIRLHQISHYYQDGESEGLRLADPQELPHAKAKEAQSLRHWFDRVWMCTRCDNSRAAGPMIWEKVMEHLLHEYVLHDISPGYTAHGAY